MGKTSKQLTLFLSIIGFGLIVSTQTVFAAPVDHSIWGELLKKHVKSGVVNYAGFKKDETRLDDYLGRLERIDTGSLGRTERMAFYINAYNAWTVKLILTGYPGVQSIKDLGSVIKSPWKIKIVRLKEGVKTLDNIEHDILRPEYKDPRIHFAVNCASKGCPPLLNKPFIGTAVDGQLERLTKRFINDPKRTRLKDNTLYLNPIFKWFSEDFGDQADFVKQYANTEMSAKLEKIGDKLEINYYRYDWSLNGM